MRRRVFRSLLLFQCHTLRDRLLSDLSFRGFLSLMARDSICRSWSEDDGSWEREEGRRNRFSLVNSKESAREDGH